MAQLGPTVGGKPAMLRTDTKAGFVSRKVTGVAGLQWQGIWQTHAAARRDEPVVEGLRYWAAGRR